MSNGVSKLIGVASGDASADTEVRVGGSHTAPGLGNDAAPPTNSRSTFSSSSYTPTQTWSRALYVFARLDDANSLRQVALQEFNQFSFVMTLKFMTNTKQSDRMLDDSW